MELSSQEIRDHVEASLRALAPADYRRMAEGDYFLTLEPRPGQTEPLALWERDREVRLFYGPGIEDYSFSAAYEDGERQDFTEDRLRQSLREIINRVKEILEEHVFAAQYKRFFLPMTGFFPVQSFATLRTRTDFVARSWRGTYSIGLPEPIEA